MPLKFFCGHDHNRHKVNKTFTLKINVGFHITNLQTLYSVQRSLQLSDNLIELFDFLYSESTHS